MAARLLVDSAKLRNLRLATGLTFEQVAVAAGITASRLRQLVATDQNARLNTVAQLAEVLGVDDPRDLLVVREK